MAIAPQGRSAAQMPQPLQLPQDMHRAAASLGRTVAGRPLAGALPPPFPRERRPRTFRIILKQPELGDVAVGRGLDPRDDVRPLLGAEQVRVAGLRRR